MPYCTYKSPSFLSRSFKVCYHYPCIIHHTILYITFGYSQTRDICSESQEALQIP